MTGSCLACIKAMTRAKQVAARMANRTDRKQVGLFILLSGAAHFHGKKVLHRGKIVFHLFLAKKSDEHASQVYSADVFSPLRCSIQEKLDLDW